MNHNRRFEFRISAALLKAIEREAKRRKMSVTEFVRSAAARECGS